MSTPYVGFSSPTLDSQPRARKGDTIACVHCKGEHFLECATDKDGKETDLLMFYRCGDKSYLGAVGGSLVTGTKADVSGRV